MISGLLGPDKSKDKFLDLSKHSRKPAWQSGQASLQMRIVCCEIKAERLVTCVAPAAIWPRHAVGCVRKARYRDWFREQTRLLLLHERFYPLDLRLGRLARLSLLGMYAFTVQTNARGWLRVRCTRAITCTGILKFGWLKISGHWPPFTWAKVSVWGKAYAARVQRYMLHGSEMWSLKEKMNCITALHRAEIRMIKLN